MSDHHPFADFRRARPISVRGVPWTDRKQDARAEAHAPWLPGFVGEVSTVAMTVDGLTETPRSWQPWLRLFRQGLVQSWLHEGRMRGIVMPVRVMRVMPVRIMTMGVMTVVVFGRFVTREIDAQVTGHLD